MMTWRAILVLCLVGFGVVCGSWAEDEVSSGVELDVLCQPWCKVEVDGEQLGNSPAERLLEPGKHRVVLRFPPDKLEVEREIEVSAGDGPVKLFYSFTQQAWLAAPGLEEGRVESMEAEGDPEGDAMITVKCVPWCKVQIDGEFRGTSPLHEKAIMSGERVITLHHPQSGEPVSKTVNVEPGTLLTIAFNFRTWSWE